MPFYKLTRLFWFCILISFCLIVKSIFDTCSHQTPPYQNPPPFSLPNSSKAEWILHKLQHCPCHRETRTAPANSEHRTNYHETTCGHDAFARGPGQKVISFSFYNNMRNDDSEDRGFFKGIKANLDRMPVFYPGWTMRLYFDLNPDDFMFDALCNLACSNSLLDLCHASNLPGTPMNDASKIFPMIWRFFPTLDPQVDLYNCRDLDSRFTDREIAAVEEWLSIGKAVHAMRDHPFHPFPLLGAAWGADLRRGNSRKLWKNSWDMMLKDGGTWASRSSYGDDQDVLGRHVWPWAKDMSVQHDSYMCKMFQNTIGFPTERRNEPNNFVTSGGFYNWTLWEECPKECRRKEHPEWVHC